MDNPGGRNTLLYIFLVVGLTEGSMDMTSMVKMCSFLKLYNAHIPYCGGKHSISGEQGRCRDAAAFTLDRARERAPEARSSGAAKA